MAEVGYKGLEILPELIATDVAFELQSYPCNSQGFPWTWITDGCLPPPIPTSFPSFPYWSDPKGIP